MPILTPTDQLRRIMISRTDGLGDVILTLPIAAAIRERIPQAEIVYLVSPYTAPMVRRVREVDTVVTVSGGRRALHVMRGVRPDAIIFARPELRLAVDALLARIDVRIGTGYRWYSGLFTRWVYDHRRTGDRHEAEYGLNLLSPLTPGPFDLRMPELPFSATGAKEAAARLRQTGVASPYIVVHPGSRGSASSYPIEAFASAISLHSERQSGLSVIVTAGPDEEEAARSIVDMAVSLGVQRGSVGVVGGVSLDGFSELLRGAEAFLGLSSGPSHLAALVGTPVVALYPGMAPMWPTRWRPIGADVSTLVAVDDEAQCPRCGRDHPADNCVARIRPERVAAALAEASRRHFGNRLAEASNRSPQVAS